MSCTAQVPALLVSIMFSFNASRSCVALCVSFSLFVFLISCGVRAGTVSACILCLVRGAFYIARFLGCLSSSSAHGRLVPRAFNSEIFLSPPPLPSHESRCAFARKPKSRSFFYIFFSRLRFGGGASPGAFETAASRNWTIRGCSTRLRSSPTSCRGFRTTPTSTTSKKRSISSSVQQSYLYVSCFHFFFT